MRRKGNDLFELIYFTLIAGVVLLLFAPIPCPASVRAGSDAWQVQGDEAVVRLHVRAAGDSEAEQRFKMDLVAQVQGLLAERGLARGNSYGDYISLLGDYLPELERSLQRYAVNVGVDQGISAQLGRENFPTRAYGRRIYPAGEYTALTITIGEGEGENWWCLLFPALCFPPANLGSSSRDCEEDSCIAGEEEPAPSLQGEAGEAENSGGADCWRIKIWEIITHPAQQIIEKAGQIFYN